MMSTLLARYERMGFGADGGNFLSSPETFNLTLRARMYQPTTVSDQACLTLPDSHAIMS